MNNKEKVVFDINNYYLLKSCYLIRKNFPSSKHFYLIMIFFKYFGIIANSRIIEMNLSENKLFINKYLSNFFIFGKNFSPVLNHYQLYTLLGAFILIILNIFVISCFLYMKARYKNVKTLYNEKFKEINSSINLEEIAFKIVSFSLLLIVFFHQYIIEYYLFGFYGFIYYNFGIFNKMGKFPDTYIDSLHDELFDYFQYNNHVLIFIINTFVIILVFIYFFIFMLFNSTKGLFLNHGMPYSGNLLYLIMKIIILSFQPLYSISNLYAYNKKEIFGISINIIIIIFCLISFWSCFHSFGYYPNSITNFSLFIEFFVFISSIIEIIQFFSGNKNDIIFFFVKLIIEIINTIFFMSLFIYFKDKYNLNLFSTNLFSKNNSKTGKGGFYYYLLTYFEYVKDKLNNYQKIFNFILTHVVNCNNIDCLEHVLIPKLIEESISNYNYNIKNNNEKKDLKDQNYQDIIMNEKNKFSDIQFQLIFEQEIINRIEYLYQNKKYANLEDYIFIHLQYLINIKKNYSLALYFVGKYNLCGIKWSFMTQYYFYEYKKFITSIFYRNTNINNVDQNANRHRKDNKFMKKIIDYFIFSAIFKNLIVSSCNKLKFIFNFRENLHSPIIVKTYNRSHTKNFINVGKLLKKNKEQILYLLYQDMVQNNHNKISVELNYILCNFFIFIDGHIPHDLKYLLNLSFDIISIGNKLNSGYKFLNLVQPLILSLTPKNTFKMTYFSSVICNRLGYLEQELKNNDFHEKLFPGKHIIKQHESIMKQFLFFDNNSFSKNNTFLKSKQGYLIGINFTAKKFPSFFDDFLIIAGIDFIDERTNKKNYHKYSFLLNDKFDFILQTKNFYEDYEFNLPMYREIKVNYLKFFNINEKKLMKKFNKKNNISERNNIRRDEDAFIIFKNINYEKSFELRDISKLQALKSEDIYVYDKIYKEKVLKIIPELLQLVDENGLDFEWYQHIENFKERLALEEIRYEDELLTEYTKNIVSLGFFMDSKKTKRYNSSLNSDRSFDIMTNRNLNSGKNNNFSNTTLRQISTLSVKNANEEESPRKLTKILNEVLTIQNYFDVVYILRKIGSINYYLVDLYEIILDRRKINYLEEMQNKFKSTISLKGTDEKIKVKLNEENYNSNIKNNSKFKNKYIKAKTHFRDLTNKKNSVLKLNNESVKSIVIENDSSNDEGNNFPIEQVRTLERNIKKKKNIIKYLSIKEKKTDNTKLLNFQSNLFLNDKKKDPINNYINKMPLNIPEKENIKEELNNKNNSANNEIKNNRDDFNYFFKRNKEKEDEEKISLISKDKLEMFIKKHYKLDKTYIIIIFIIYFITIILIIALLIISQISFSFNSILKEGVIALQEIKSDLFIGSIIILSKCLIRYDDILEMQNNFEFQMQSKGRELMNHLSIFENIIKYTNKNKLTMNIINHLYGNITIFTLDSDWNIKNETSYFLKEINYFVYSLNEQSTQDQNNIMCDFENNFYLLFFNTSQEIYKINGNKEPSFNLKFLYYIIVNVIYIIKPIFYDIFEILIEAQLITMETYYNLISIINTSLIFIIILCEIIILLKNRLDIIFIKKIFILLYQYEKNEIQLEYEIHFLEIVAKEFNLNNLIILENLKKYNYYYLFVRQSQNSNEEIDGDEINLNSLDKNKNQNFSSSIINRKKGKENLGKNSAKDINLNNSFNNSGIHLLNKNFNELSKLKNDKKNQKQERIKEELKNSKMNNKDNENKPKIDGEMKKEINNLIKEEEEKIKDNEVSFYIIKSNNNFIPYTFLFSIYFSVFFIIIIVLLIIGNFINCSHKKDLWEYSINFSMNYFEKIPKIIELGLSAYITVIVGKLDFGNFYSKEEYKVNQFNSFKYFSKFKGYENSELIPNNIENSYFANVLYDCYKIKKNIKYCEKDSFIKHYFKEIKFWNQKLSEQNNFCINSCLGSLLFFNSLTTKLEEFFFGVNVIATSCLEESAKINENGLDLEIDYILSEITSLYLDFVQRLKSNIDINLARKNFFENNNFKNIIKDINLPFQLALGTIYSSLSNDINKLNNYESFLEIAFICVTFFADVLFLIFLLLMIYFNESDKNILIFISKILKKY